MLKNGEAVLPDGKADTVSPEQAAAAAIDDRPLLARVHAAIAGDEKLELLLEGITTKCAARNFRTFWASTKRDSRL